jgi:hypothetical protein
MACTWGHRHFRTGPSRDALLRVRETHTPTEREREGEREREVGGERARERERRLHMRCTGGCSPLHRRPSGDTQSRSHGAHMGRCRSVSIHHGLRLHHVDNGPAEGPLVISTISTVIFTVMCTVTWAYMGTTSHDDKPLGQRR